VRQGGVGLTWPRAERREDHRERAEFASEGAEDLSGEGVEEQLHALGGGGIALRTVSPMMASSRRTGALVSLRPQYARECPECKWRFGGQARGLGRWHVRACKPRQGR
jgi:hypothetical protein